MKIAHESAAYFPQPGNSITSLYVLGRARNQAFAIVTRRRDRTRQRPSGRRTSSSVDGSTSASDLMVCLSMTSRSAGLACSQVVRFTRLQATSIQNGRLLSASWKSLPLLGLPRSTSAMVLCSLKAQLSPGATSRAALISLYRGIFCPRGSPGRDQVAPRVSGSHSHIP